MTPELNAAEREAVEKAKAWEKRAPTEREDEISDVICDEDVQADDEDTDLERVYSFACGYLSATADARERALKEAATIAMNCYTQAGVQPGSSPSRTADTIASAILALLRPASEKEAT